MALETATYIANLVVTNPDGGDAANTLEDHIRLIKAALRRSFPNVDGAVSLSAAQVMYLNDVSASVQLQLNQLRDGSATANNALFANSASVAANVGGIPAARVPDLAASPNTLTGGEPIRFTNTNAFFSWYISGVRQGFVQAGPALGMALVTETSLPFQVYTSNTLRMTISPDGSVAFTGPIAGHISSASYAVSAGTAATATNATNATTAATATFANTCTSASSAAALGGFTSDDAAGPATIARRTAAGHLYAVNFNQTSGLDNVSVGHVACMTNLDGFWRVNSLANLGAYLEARNITGRTGIAKTLSTSTPSGGSNGDIWYRHA